MSGSSEVVDRLRAVNATIATAESLTGGLLCAALVDTPGASDVVLGGVVAYSAEAKSDLLGVDEELMAERGTIDAGVAAAMAAGVRDRFGAAIGVATTGNAGPDGSEGKPVGLVWIAVADAHGVRVQQVDLSGDRNAIREGAVRAALSLVVARLGEESAEDVG